MSVNEPFNFPKCHEHFAALLRHSSLRNGAGAIKVGFSMGTSIGWTSLRRKLVNAKLHIFRWDLLDLQKCCLSRFPMLPWAHYVRYEGFPLPCRWHHWLSIMKTNVDSCKLAEDIHGSNVVGNIAFRNALFCVHMRLEVMYNKPIIFNLPSP